MNEELTDKMVTDKAALASATTELMEKLDPDLFARYPSYGRARCIEDTAFHVDYLAAALEVDDHHVFMDYVGWLTTLLAARNIPIDDIEHNFEALAQVLLDRYGDPAASAAALLRRSTRDA